MATAKRLVELHRGRVEVSSPEGSGASITVHLPSGNAEDLPA
jgi:signal transduction histidine kinase